MSSTTDRMQPRPLVRPGRARDPLWMQLFGVTVLFALLEGFGSYFQIIVLSPTKYLIPQMILLASALVLLPRGRLRGFRIPLPLLAFVVWWAMSYAWSSSGTTYIRISLHDMLILFIVVLAAQILPFDSFIKLLIRSGYAVLFLIVAALAINPSGAYMSEGGAPGLRGGFIHKNQLAPCIIFIALVILCFDTRTWLRRTAVVLVLALLVLARTTTGEATFVMLLIARWFFIRYAGFAKSVGRPLRTVIVGSVALGGVLAFFSYAPVVRLSGKDLTFSSRTKIWGAVLWAVSKRKVAGYGWDVYLNLAAEPALGINIRTGFVEAESHGVFFELLLRLGIVGFVLWLVFIAHTVWLGWRVMRTGSGAPLGVLTLLLCYLMIGFGFSESLPVQGVWLGLVGAFSVLSSRQLAARA
jgi:O-antigen ligase